MATFVGQKSVAEDNSFSTTTPSISETKGSTLPVQTTTNGAHSFNFWEVGGYRKTVKRCESGHKLLDDLMQFFQERGDIEKAYAKSLQQFAKRWRESLDRGSDYGTNLQAWKAFLTQAEKTADVHLRVKEQLDTEICEEIRKWTKSKYVKGKLALNFGVVKSLEEEFRRAQKPWEKHLDMVNEARKTYFSACKAEKTAKVHYDNAQRNSSAQTMDQIAKLRDKLDVCHSETQQTREAYREALSHLYSVRPRYQNEMQEAFKTAQRFEQERMMFFKTTFYRCHEILNVFSPPARMNSIAEQLGSAIAASDSVKDTNQWASGFGSDMDIECILPVFMEYSDVNHTISRKGGIAENANDGAVILRSVNVRDPSEISSGGGGSAPSSAKKPGSVEKQQPQQQTREAEITRQYSDVTHANGNGHVTTNGTTNGNSNGHGPIVVDNGNGEIGVHVWALYSYEAQENDELSFDEGDEILKMTEEDEQGWCKGKLMQSGRIGLFPAAYVSDRQSDSAGDNS